MTLPLRDIAISQLPLFRRGKVRDTYELGEDLLMVATDRISAFDVILPDGIPDKGRILTQLSVYWFGLTRHLMPNHLVTSNTEDLPDELAGIAEILRERFMIVRRADRIDVECVVRGYLAGSAWAEYQASGTVCGHELPPGLRESEKLPAPIFTPATKAEEGHDINISIREMRSLVGDGITSQTIEASFNLFEFASSHAQSRGLILADTKFEFGFIDESLTLIDEALTPDSSRYWDADTYEPGRPQESFDKQFVRDWLIDSGWDRIPPAPPLPGDVIAGTARRYREAYERITGEVLPDR